MPSLQGAEFVGAEFARCRSDQYPYNQYCYDYGIIFVLLMRPDENYFATFFYSFLKNYKTSVSNI